MRMKIIAIVAFLTLGMAVTAQNQDGGISPEMMNQIKTSYSGQGADKALRNAMVNNNLTKLALNYENANFVRLLFLKPSGKQGGYGSEVFRKVLDVYGYECDA